MAFEIDQIKSSGAGFGVAPAIFTYGTDDDEATVETANYFREGAPILNVGDIIYVSYDLSTEAYIVSHVAFADGGAHEVNVQEQSVFVGDDRGTDIAGDGATTGMSLAIMGAEGLFNFFTYRNNSTTKAGMLASGYFWGAGILRVGDLISCVASDGFQNLRVTFVGDSTEPITTELVTLA